VALWRAAGTAVALKIESPDITHKTEVGGVLLKLDDEAAVRQAFRTLMARARQQRPQARLDGVLVQPMAGGHLELVVGVQRDAAFGPVVMVGFGGVLVEVLKDVAFRRAPFDDDEALAMLAELRMAPLLDGVRGQPAVDRRRHRAAAQSRAVALGGRPCSRWLAELDLNPVRVGPEGPLAVDCVMVLRHEPCVGAPEESLDNPHKETTTMAFAPRRSMVRLLTAAAVAWPAQRPAPRCWPRAPTPAGRSRSSRPTAPGVTRTWPHATSPPRRRRCWARRWWWSTRPAPAA
jgi:hypothetical protein